MISLIICSRTSSIPARLEENIIATVGCDYELIIINNSKNTYSISEAYNLGIKKSKGEFVCLLHDDIIFRTPSWGFVISEILDQNPEVGLIGVAGSKFKTKFPSPWWEAPLHSKYINLIQHFKPEEKRHWHQGFKKENEVEVVIIDGLFMAMRKIPGIRFNPKIKGFHNYDLNISLEYYIKGFTILVTNRILIEHFSLGNLNKSWYQSAMQVHEIYKDYLPLNIRQENPKRVRIQEYTNGMRFINGLLSHRKKKDAFKYWFNLLQLKPLSKFHFKFIKALFTP